MGTEKKAAAEVQENQTEQAAAQVQAPVAYCGPTIKGIAPQYTVFVDGLPDKLKENVYAPNFTIYGSMNAEDLRSIMDEGYEKFCEYVERYEREKRRTQYGT